MGCDASGGGQGGDRGRERERERKVSRVRIVAVDSMRWILVFDFVLTCRHYGIRFGQPPVEKAPSWSWISITVVMATAIDSTGVRADEENRRERPRERRHKGYSRRRVGARESRERSETSMDGHGLTAAGGGRERGGPRARPGRVSDGREKDRTGLERGPAERSTEGTMLLWWCYTALALSDTMQAK